MAVKKNNTADYAAVLDNTLTDVLGLCGDHQILVKNVPYGEAKAMNKKGWSYIVFQSGYCQTIPTKTMNYKAT